MIELKIRFWTNNISKKKNEIIPKHAWDAGVVSLEKNVSHGIGPKNPRPFHSMMDLSAIIERVLIAHGVKLHRGRHSTKYVEAE